MPISKGDNRGVVYLHFHGVVVSVSSKDEQLLDYVRHDFSYFIVERQEEDLKIEFRLEKVNPNKLPPMESSAITARNIVFKNENVSYVDYFGRALNICKIKFKSYLVITDDKNIGREIIYLTILSRVSSILERRRIHRIHALGFVYDTCGGLVLLPSGGGKTTLALSLLNSNNEKLKLMSEDSPLLTHDGKMLPFPLRIGVLEHSLPVGINKDFTRRTPRMEFGTKITIDALWKKEKIATLPIKTNIVLIGKRSTKDSAIILPISTFCSIKACLVNLVIGVGLFQGMEFIAQNSTRDILVGLKILVSRFVTNIKLLLTTKKYSFVLGRNPEENIKVLVEFLEKNYKN